jgi:hypothetical protein
MSTPPPPLSAAATPAPAPRRSLDLRRLGVVGAIGLAVAALILGAAALLDDPTGPRPSTALPAQEAFDLPVFATVLDRPTGDRDTPIPEQVRRLEQRVQEERSPQRLLELGTGYQRLGQPARGEPFLREALQRDPGFLHARVALIMGQGAAGKEALERAKQALVGLFDENPQDQLVGFNLAIAALYDLDDPLMISAFERVRDIDPDTVLGLGAVRFLRERAKADSSRSEP